MISPDVIEGLGPRGTKPLVNSAAPLRDAGLTPAEGFVLSRVDGHTTYGQLCNLTGLGAAATIEILKKLKVSGLIHNPGEPAAVPLPRTPVTTPPAPAAKQPAPETSVLARLDDGSPVDPSDLLDGPDLDAVIKTRLIRVTRRLGRLSAHELLGVPANADAKMRKRAYFLASKELHPDRFYGKNLGMFRGLLERLFRAVSEAFESLEKVGRG